MADYFRYDFGADNMFDYETERDYFYERKAREREEEQVKYEQKVAKEKLAAAQRLAVRKDFASKFKKVSKVDFSEGCFKLETSNGDTLEIHYDQSNCYTSNVLYVKLNGKSIQDYMH